MVTRWWRGAARTGAPRAAHARGAGFSNLVAHNRVTRGRSQDGSADGTHPTEHECGRRCIVPLARTAIPCVPRKIESGPGHIILEVCEGAKPLREGAADVEIECCFYHAARRLIGNVGPGDRRIPVPNIDEMVRAINISEVHRRGALPYWHYRSAALAGWSLRALEPLRALDSLRALRTLGACRSFWSYGPLGTIGSGGAGRALRAYGPLRTICPSRALRAYGPWRTISSSGAGRAGGPLVSIGIVVLKPQPHHVGLIPAIPIIIIIMTPMPSFPCA